MYDQQVEADASSAGTRNVSGVVAGSIIVLAIVLAVLISRQTPQFQSEALVRYQADGTSLAVGTAAGAALANRVLDDATLIQFITRYDLYGQERQHATSGQLASRMRGRLVISQASTNDLRLVFRDADAEKTHSVTNAAAGALAAYHLEQSVPAASQPAPPAGKQVSRPRPSRPSRRALRLARTRARRGVARTGAGVVVAENPAVHQELQKINQALQLLGAARAELQAERADTAAKIAAAGSGQTAASNDAMQAERIRVEQQIAAERTKLSDLHSRYTEDYPDVQRSEQRVADLEAREARLPAAPAKPVPAKASWASLQSDAQREDADLAKNQAATAAEQQHRSQVLQQSKRPGLTNAGSKTDADVAEPPEEAAATGEPAPPVASPVPPPLMQQVSLSPFRLLQPAQNAIPLGMSKRKQWTWLAGGTAVLLLICLLPLVPVHHPQDAVILQQAEDARNHVTYLGGSTRAKSQDESLH